MIIVDTHVLIWWIGAPGLLSERARTAIQLETIGVAAMTCWEIAFLAHRKRIAIDDDVSQWLEAVFALPRVELLPMTIDIAVAAATMPIPLRDPADRMIMATALHHNAPLVTKDERIRVSGVVETIW